MYGCSCGCDAARMTLVVVVADAAGRIASTSNMSIGVSPKKVDDKRR